MARTGGTTSARPAAQHLWGANDCAPEALDGGAAAQFDLCVLASGSAGNCSLLVRGDGPFRRVTMIDCGLSPLRTRRMLAGMGLGFDRVDDILVTHLDSDHFHPGWTRALPRHARLHLHARHIRRAVKEGIDTSRVELFDSAFAIPAGVTIHPTLVEHDAWGVVAFRFDFGRESLGYATDVGSVTPELIDAMRGVDVLAIESNYCPEMQIASERPEFLKQRIMGGSGHLSNGQCADAVRAIGSARHVVLLHLSRQCNTPERASAAHIGAAYALTVTSQHEPAPAVVVRRAPATA
jgi:phosphoribosyl 1,2-cyclic phosphodiesterase